MNNYYLPFDGIKEGGILEIGAGAAPIFRPSADIRMCCDAVGNPTVDIVCDLSEPLNIPSESYFAVFSKFAVEHISYRKTKQLLLEIHRILKPNGKFVFIVPNTLEQMRWVLNRYDEDGTWDKDSSCCIFGDNDYPENTHRVSFSPSSIIRDLQEVGFENILVIPFGELATDMVIECTKPKEVKMIDKVEPMTARQELFDKHYFHGGSKVGGYAHEGYRDFYNHWFTFHKIMEYKPQSILELGCSRGYNLKRFQDIGIPVGGLEISKHCYLTRVIDNITEWDLCKTPWEIPDNYFDFCFSVAVLEHIPEEHLPKIIEEINRVSKRGLHGVDFGENDDGFDKTHCTLRPQDWWEERFPISQQIINKELLECLPENTLPQELIPAGDGKLKVNIGCFTNMFHNGWLNLDIVSLEEFAQNNGYKFLQKDVRGNLPFADQTVDLIYSSHFLEHLTYDEGRQFLRECRRVLKNDGVMRIIVPDAQLLIEKYASNQLSEFNEINDGVSSTNSQVSKLWSLLFSGHQSTYDFETLKVVGEESGFNVERKLFRQGHPQILAETLDLLPDLSLFVEMTRIGVKVNAN